MSQNWVKNYFLVLTFLTFITACNLDSIDEPFIVAEVEKEFNLDLWEDLRPNGRVLQLIIETIEDEDCTNYTIDYNYLPSSSKFDISILDIVPPADCNEGQAPARTIVDLGRPSAGFHELDIDLKNTVFSYGQISVAENSYKVNMEEEKGIIFLRRELLRVPENTIWGYIGVQDVSDIQIADSFVAEINDKGLQRTYDSGYYGYYNINLDGQVNMDTNFESENLKTFILEYDGADIDLEELAQTYRNAYGDAIELKIYTDEGKEI